MENDLNWFVPFSRWKLPNGNLCSIYRFIVFITSSIPFHNWRLNLNNNALYILSLVLMLPDKGFFYIGCISVVIQIKTPFIQRSIDHFSLGGL